MRHNKSGWMGLAALMLMGSSLIAFAQDAPPVAPGGTPAAPGGRGGRGQGRGPGQGFGRPTPLAGLPVAFLAKQLNLTADQKAKVTTIHTQYETDLKAAPAPTQEDFQAGQDVIREKMQKRNQVTQTASDAINALLTEDQKKMIPDMNKELQLYMEAGIPVGVAGDLKLTEEQKKKIKAQAEANRTAMQTKMQELRQQGGGDRQAMMQAMQAAQKENSDKIMDILLPSQKVMVEAYKKAHPNEVMGGGFGFGGPGGGRGGRGGGRGGAGAPGGAAGGN